MWVPVQSTPMASPTPLKTILSPVDYPFAVAHVRDGKISEAVAYASTLEDCYFQTQGWRASTGTADFIMVENREIREATPDQADTYWVAV